MPIDISWYIPSRVIHARIYGQVNPEHFQVFPTTARQYMLQGIMPVHCLIDDGNSVPLTFTIGQLRRLLKFHSEDSDRIGWIVGVGDVPMLANILIPLLLKTMGLNFKRVRTMEQAIDFLKTEDPTLIAYLSAEEEQV